MRKEKIEPAIREVLLNYFDVPEGERPEPLAAGDERFLVYVLQSIKADASQESADLP